MTQGHYLPAEVKIIIVNMLIVNKISVQKLPLRMTSALYLWVLYTIYQPICIVWMWMAYPNGCGKLKSREINIVVVTDD